MFKKLQVAAILLCMLSYAAAGTVSIGTVNARGDVRVDSYPIKGNATLFDGSVVETGQASADVRLNKGAEITMSTGSRGTLFSDHLVLQQGQSELMASNTFALDVSGLHVKPSQPNSRALVSMKPGNTVEISSVKGSVGVSDSHGVMLANILPGHSFSFAMDAGPQNGVFSGVGLVSFENGQYYLTTDSDVKYLLTCRDMKKYVDDKVVVSGTVQTTAGPNGTSQSTLCVKDIDINGGEGPMNKKWLIDGILIAAGAGAIAGIIVLATKPSHPISPP
jgi:hypothetical protein